MKVTTEDFILSEEKLKRCTQPDVLACSPSKKSAIQKAIGYTDPMMLLLYQIAVDLSENKSHDESVAAFKFLCILNPYIAPFWIGLGVSQVQQQDFEGAIKSYERAIEVDPTNIQGYLYAIKYYLDNKGPQKARQILDGGLQQAEGAECPESWEQFLQLAPAIGELIQQGA